jgi:hypothetical protein
MLATEETEFISSEGLSGIGRSTAAGICSAAKPERNCVTVKSRF